MNNNTTAMLLLTAEGRTALLLQLQKATSLELLNAASSLAEASQEALNDVLQSGWLRLYFAEWQLHLKRLAYRFTYPVDSGHYMRLVRDGNLSGLLSEMEAFQLFGDGYFLLPDDMTLNIQCSYSRTIKKPCYRVPLEDISGFLFDCWTDYPVHSDKVRMSAATALTEVSDKVAKKPPAEALMFALRHSALLSAAHAQTCFPVSLSIEALQVRLKALAKTARQYATLMNTPPAGVATGLWRVDVSVGVGDSVREFSFFTPPADTPERTTFTDDMGLLHVVTFDGEGGAFRKQRVYGYDIIDVITDTPVAHVAFTNNSDEENEKEQAELTA